MQAAYVDKYEERLKEAMEKATFIPSFKRWKVDYMEPLGTRESSNGNKHYYYDKEDDEYHYESDFDREMRLILQKKKNKNHTKK